VRCEGVRPGFDMAVDEPHEVGLAHVDDQYGTPASAVADHASCAREPDGATLNSSRETRVSELAAIEIALTAVQAESLRWHSGGIGDGADCRRTPYRSRHVKRRMNQAPKGDYYDLIARAGGTKQLLYNVAT
jgi:hypothetical protein